MWGKNNQGLFSPSIRRLANRVLPKAKATRMPRYRVHHHPVPSFQYPKGAFLRYANYWDRIASFPFYTKLECGAPTKAGG